VDIAFIAIVVSFSVVDERPTEGTNNKGKDLEKRQHWSNSGFFTDYVSIERIKSIKSLL